MANVFYIVKQIIEVDEIEHRMWVSEKPAIASLLEHNNPIFAEDGVTIIGHSWISGFGEISKEKAEELKYQTYPKGA